jgi:hypothetical protein
VETLVGQIAGLADELCAAAPYRQLLGLGVEMGAHVHDGRILQYTNASWARTTGPTPTWPVRWPGPPN